MSIFGIDTFADNELHGQSIWPFYLLADVIKHHSLESLDNYNLHFFYDTLVMSNLFRGDLCSLSMEQILSYEENIVRHTQAINGRRHRPVALNESENQFVTDLKAWYEDNMSALEKECAALFLLRNMSMGKGIGLFEAGNFHPDFVLWMLAGGKQYVH